MNILGSLILCSTLLLANYGYAATNQKQANLPQRVPYEPEMVKIPTGSYEMGSNDFARESPVHRVNIAKPFELGKFEVTVAQFRIFVNATSYRTDAENPASRKVGCRTHEEGKWDWRKGRYWENTGFAQTENHPVACISWNDAQAYIKWLNNKTGKQYRLPSESEWEYACHAGKREQFCGASNSDVVAWKNDNSDDKSHPVGTKAANVWGLHDLSGNVWEWMQDKLQGNYQGAPNDGSAWQTQSSTQARTLRGGSWAGYTSYSRSTERYGDSPDVSFSSYGFRLARSIEQ